MNRKFLFGALLVTSVIIVYLVIQRIYGIFLLPYFWDELGVYSRAALHMSYHGIGMLPSSLPDELSRGHPILIPFLFSIPFKLFGPEIFVARIFAVLIYTIGIVFLYRILLLKYTPFYAYLFSLLVFLQPCFLSQSMLVLPEIPLMVAAICAMYYFMKGNYVQVSVCLTIALFIKESAIILPFAFYLADVLKNKFNTKGLVLLLFVPFTLIILFFVIQYFQRGYVFFPLHTSLVKIEIYYIKERFGELSDFVFFIQGRAIIFLFPILLLVLNFRKLVQWIKDFRLNSIFQENNLLFSGSILIAAAGISFCSLNYFIYRYSLYFLVFLYIAAIYLVISSSRMRLVHYSFAAMLLAISIVYNYEEEYTDVNFSYVDHIKTSQAAINELNSQHYKGKKVAMDFPLSACTWNPTSGYFTELKFKPENLKDSTDMPSDYYVFTNPGNISDTIRFGTKLRLQKQIRSKVAFVNIYSKRE